MATVIRREIRQRGFFGWVFLILFMGFNALMLLWVIGGWVAIGQLSDSSDGAKLGHAIGGAIGTAAILFIWVIGTIILGFLALLTRGRKTIIEETR